MTTHSLRLAVLLLAAGQGSRLGSVPKSLLKKDGKSLLRRFCNVVESFKPLEFLVVTGFHAEQIEEELAQMQVEASLEIRAVRNSSHVNDQASSVRLGLESLQSDFDVLLVALSDQPLIGASEIAELLEDFAKRTATEEIILPLVDGQRGNPVLFSRAVIERILKIPKMVCRPYMDEHSSLVRILHSSNAAYIIDIDTPEDLSKQGLSLP
ncbi:nucleotidyltransferase family protein [Polynucleobacter meluiroseus]|nr:nucleotidyltransferase family protein [Polynucleobacter meluiroseus]